MGIIALVFFYLRRQKKANEQNNTQEQMSVNWDEIEDHYKEIPAAKSNFPQSTSPSFNGTTAVDNNNVYHSANRDPAHAANFFKPSVVPENEYSTVKPDAL